MEQLPKTKDVVHSVFNAVKEYSKLAGEIPVEDYDYHMAFHGFKKQIVDQGKVLLDLIDASCRMIPKKRRISFSTEEAQSSSNVTVTEVQRAAIMESLDSLLENVDIVLDEARGKKLNASEQLFVTFGSQLAGGETSSGDNKNALASSSHGKGGSPPHFPSIIRPQLTFSTPVDNSPQPFVPTFYNEQGTPKTGIPGVHPFKEIISKFSPKADQLLPKTEVPFVSLSTCPLHFVDSEDVLREVAQNLMREKEIAVDLEHHDTYSYQGFTCLMQISTRTDDIIIDCLKLRSVMHILSPVFLNPKILKVFHGAREDVRWLQKDFGLYLLNFFDTSIALQTLHMPYSLYFAVDHFCQVKLDKKYQTADWRIRPIPAEMIHYARQDTHYLLYCYDRLKALLLNSEGRASLGNLLLHVYEESKQLSLSTYEKPELVADLTYKKALGRSLGGLSATQERVAREIFNWRDAAAREVDDSPAAVLHLSSVLSIASKLPTTARELLRCCTPISAAVRKNIAHLVEIVNTELGDDKVNLTEANLKTELETPTQEGSQVTFYSRRPLGIYRPMSGCLPSLSTRVNFPPVESFPEVEKKQILLDENPSSWFQSMAQIAKILTAKAPYRVAIPESEIAETPSSSLPVEKEAKRTKKNQGIENDKEAKIHSKAEDAATSEDDKEGAITGMSQGHTEEKEVIVEEQHKGDTSSSAAVFGEAFSLRQRYGKGGAKKRKRE